jgi:transcriptional regulator with XRE-family HTH domain
MNPTTKKTTGSTKRMSSPPTEEWLTRPGGIAERLRRARTAAKLTGKELAQLAGWAPSKVSRLETGGQMPTTADLDTWAELCHLGKDAAAELRALLDEVQSARSEWVTRFRGGQIAVQRDYNKLVAASSRIRYFETVWVPGLLQTPEYAHITFTGIAALHGTPRDEIGGAVRARMERQRHLYDTGKQFEFLIAEPVLRWLLCPPDVMRGQLDRLQSVIGLPNVRIGILPMGVPLRVAPQNGFHLYDELAIVESFTAEDQRRGPEAKKYGEIMDLLWDQAVEGEDARPLIVAAAESLPVR